MTAEEYREKINPCYGCDCWDEDMGCLMAGVDRTYACPLEDGKEKEGDENRILYGDGTANDDASGEAGQGSEWQTSVL